MTAPDFVSRLAARGEAPALIFPGRPPLSYGDLAERVDRQAAALAGEKSLVAVEARSSEQAIVAYLAALRAGHAVALLPPDAPSTLETCEAAFRPDFIFRQIAGRWRRERRPRERDQRPHPDLAVLLSTSGSTGEGNSVRLSRGNIAANAQAIAGFLGITPGDRGCLVLPLHYCYGLSVLNSHLSAGASLYVPGGSILDPGFLDGLAAAGCTNFAGVPHSYDLLEQVGFRDADLPSMRFMTVAGGRLAPGLVRSYDRRMSERGGAFFVMYGQTEATARIAYVPPERLPGNEDRIGIAIPGGELTLVDENGMAIRQPDMAGELVYRGPNVMMGYARSRGDLARGADLDALRTGDLALQDADGLFRIVGRLKRISKISGLRISHDALERALEREGIAAAVVGDDAGLQAFFTGPRTEHAVADRLAAASGLTRAHLRATRMAELPRLPSGKLDYARLRKEMVSLRDGAACAGVSEAFREAFYPRPVRREDSFVSLGGDSLRFLQLSLALERAVGTAPPGWERMTVAQIERLGRRETAGRSLGGDMLVRVAAILLVVVHHQTLWPIPGGAAAMVMLVGFSLARFQAPALLAGQIGRLLAPALQVLVPYYLIVAGYALAWGEVPWASVFLVGNFGFADPAQHTMLPYLYWFVELYGQILLLVAGLFASPRLRAFCAADPFRAGMVLFALALAARFALPAIVDMGNRQIFTLPWNLYIAALGWSAAFADTLRKRAVLLAAASATFLYFGVWDAVWIGTTVKFTLQIAVLAALLFTPRLRLPGLAARSILLVAAASFQIYLLHRFVPEIFLVRLADDLPDAVFDFLAILGGVALGVGAFALQQWLRRWAVQPRLRRPHSVPAE